MGIATEKSKASVLYTSDDVSVFHHIIVSRHYLYIQQTTGIQNTNTWEPNIKKKTHLLYNCIPIPNSHIITATLLLSYTYNPMSKEKHRVVSLGGEVVCNWNIPWMPVPKPFDWLLSKLLIQIFIMIFVAINAELFIDSVTRQHVYLALKSSSGSTGTILSSAVHFKNSWKI